MGKPSAIVVNGHLCHVASVDVGSSMVSIAPAASPNQELQTVPSRESWELIGASITATTTATVGNRTFRVRVRNSAGNVFYQTAVGANIPASQTGIVQTFPVAAGVFVPSGLIVEAVDSAAVDANDVINLNLVVKKHFEVDF
jgi:hypothetical protein